MYDLPPPDRLPPFPRALVLVPRPPTPPPHASQQLCHHPYKVFGGVGGAAGALDDLIVVANKADLAAAAAGVGAGEQGEGLNDELNALAAEAATAAPVGTAAARAAQGPEGGRVWKLSCKTKEGLEGFMEHLEAEVRSRFQGAADDESPLITRCVRRHIGPSRPR